MKDDETPWHQGREPYLHLYIINPDKHIPYLAFYKTPLGRIKILLWYGDASLISPVALSLDQPVRKHGTAGIAVTMKSCEITEILLTPQTNLGMVD